MKTVIFFLAFLLVAFSMTLNKHTQPKPDKYLKFLQGRNMTISICFHKLPDQVTQFNFAPKETSLTIIGCNTYACSYTVNLLNWKLDKCDKKTQNTCPNETTPDYINRLQSATKLKFQSNELSFVNSTDNVQIQLMDKVAA
jgi:hypothetical protein